MYTSRADVYRASFQTRTACHDPTSLCPTTPPRHTPWPHPGPWKATLRYHLYHGKAFKR